tara:strand:- start:229 stop:930 length:702 start_codon:yes stop_codon:yes gene_type:complete
MNNQYLGIITARSGSKRLPNKNIKVINGKPLMVWSIMASLKCKKITRTFLSTDSPSYQKIGIEVGADCPWLRGKYLSKNNTTSEDVVNNILEKIGRENLEKYNGLILLQPTSPLRKTLDINNAINLYEESKAPAVVSINESQCPPHWIGELDNDLLMDKFFNKKIHSNSTHLGKNWYRLNGAIYIIDINIFLKEKNFRPSGTKGYIMPKERSIDIDNEFDFKIAEFLMNGNAS